MIEVSRRQLLQGGLASLLLSQGTGITAAYAEGSTVTIAYNVNLPSWDPTTGLSAVNPTIQAIYRSVFDQFIGQKPSLEFQPGLLTEWGWSDDKKQVHMTVRDGVKWHDGQPFTAKDVQCTFHRLNGKIPQYYRRSPREAWFDTLTGHYLNWPTIEILRRYGDRFRFHVLSYEEIFGTLEEIHALITRYGRPDVQSVTSVSPVPLDSTFRTCDIVTANRNSL